MALTEQLPGSALPLGDDGVFEVHRIGFLIHGYPQLDHYTHLGTRLTSCALRSGRAYVPFSSIPRKLELRFEERNRALTVA